MVIHRKDQQVNENKRGIPIKLTAYHEAGHAVMAYILRLRLIEITIIPDEDYLGRVSRGASRTIHPDWEADQKTRTELERLSMQALAGNVAEHLFTGRRHKAGSYADYHKVVNYLSFLAGPKEMTYYVEYLWHRTKGTLRADHWWLAVQRLTEELLKCRRLRSKRIREIIRQAIDEDFYRKVQSHK